MKLPPDAKIISPQAGPQLALVACPVFELFFGGARGGGKTVGMLIDFVSHAFAHNKHVTGVFFRRTAKQLEEVIKESFNFYPGFGAEWRAGTQTWEFVSGAAAGARLKFRHLWDERDAANYQGQNLTWVCFEEIVNWPTPEPINLLRACLRSAAGVPVFFRATGNPGGPGHQWVKSRYIDPSPAGYRIVTDEETGEQRVFIPSRMEDNRLLMQNDPAYERRILSVGGALAKAWRWGTWDIVAGGFFDDIWNPDRHILKPFKIPAGWAYRRSFDWGSSKPSALGIWAISDGSPVPELGGRVFPRGSAILVEEWYTVAVERNGIVKPNEGLKLMNAELGAGIVQRSAGRKFSGCVADPSIFAEQGGPSIYAQMRQGAKTGGGLSFQPADNARIPGWTQMREMFAEAAKPNPEKPGLWVFSTCTHFIRTVPVLQRDPKKPDDIDTSAEDHAADAARYLVRTLSSRSAQSTPIRGFY